MRDVFIKRLSELAERNSRIMLLTGDLGFGVLDNFAKKFPKQFVNVGVAEQNMTGIATGLALDGRVVFTYSIANFSTLRCLEQIRNDAAYHGANVKVVSIGGGFSYGALGMSHHATEDLAILRSIPEMTVLSPSDDWEVEKGLDALVNTQGTAYFRLDKMSTPSSERLGGEFRLGQPRILVEGKGLMVIGTGGVMKNLRAAYRDAFISGSGPTLVSLHTIKPIILSDSFLSRLSQHQRLLFVEEHVSEGGLASAFVEALWKHNVSRIPDVKRACIQGGFCSKVGSQEYLQAEYGLSVEKLKDLLRENHS